ncbi:hypothetical protein [Nocardia wallacei]|uniref:hypothetical protein n=1 Tax=Nocardia wallacei TaxID=480035 RepID=UPI0024553871|nr:hypothetical protein [Nocardia wallacei]
MYSAYGAHFPGRHPEAFGTDIEERYQWLFRFEPPQLGHRMHEITTAYGLTIVATTRRGERQPAGSTPYLFVLTDSGCGYDILASIQGMPATTPRFVCRGRDELLQHLHTRLCTTNATMLATTI